jgi:hypothetical protein
VKGGWIVLLCLLGGVVLVVVAMGVIFALATPHQVGPVVTSPIPVPTST